MAIKFYFQSWYNLPEYKNVFDFMVHYKIIIKDVN